MANKEEREYTAECTLTVTMWATNAEDALDMIQAKIDDIGLSGTIESLTDDNGNDCTDGEDHDDKQE